MHGRLRAIAGKPVEAERYEDERARQLVGREFHLTFTGKLPSDNHVLVGELPLVDFIAWLWLDKPQPVWPEMPSTR